MQIPLVMTVIGEDRPGLVESVARLVAEHQGNWLDSRMCRLGGQFAGILRVRIPKNQEANLEQALAALQSEGLKVVTQPDAGELDSAPGQNQARSASIELVGQDRPGIVRQISAALAQHQVNVEEFSSQCSSAPMSGETLFNAKVRLQIPPACDAAELRQELEKIAGDLMVDIAFAELESATGSK